MEVEQLGRQEQDDQVLVVMEQIVAQLEVQVRRIQDQGVVVLQLELVGQEQTEL